MRRCTVCNSRIPFWAFWYRACSFSMPAAVSAMSDRRVFLCGESCYETLFEAIENGFGWVYNVKGA